MLTIWGAKFRSNTFLELAVTHNSLVYGLQGESSFIFHLEVKSRTAMI